MQVSSTDICIMNNFQLASAILRGKWLIEPNFAISQGAILQGILNSNEFIPQGKASDEEPAMTTAAQAVVSPFHLRKRYNDIPEGATAVIPICGALMKYDQECGPEGTATIANYIKLADKHPNINRIILNIDSPGGTVDGTETLADVVKATDTEIIALIDGMMCSAALWIGSSADKVYATNLLDEVGSVGVVLSFADTRPMYEAAGVKFHTIVADTSPDKVKRFDEILAGNYENYKKEVLNPIDERFMTTIRANRPNVEDKHLTGKVFFAKDVLGVFVDEIATLDELLAMPLANSNQVNSNIQNNTKMENYPLLAALMLAANQADMTLDADGELTLNAEQLQAVNDALSNYQGDTSAIEAERDQAIEARQTAQQALATANATVAELEEKLDNTPGARTAAAVTRTDGGKETLSEDQKAIKEAQDLLAEYKQNGSLTN